jgi:hypothetical protein
VPESVSGDATDSQARSDAPQCIIAVAVSVAALCTAALAGYMFFARIGPTPNGWVPVGLVMCLFGWLVGDTARSRHGS